MSNPSSTSISREASYSSIDGSEYTALQFAVRKGSVEQVRYLLESDSTAELDAGPDPALHLAIKQANGRIAKMLLDAGANFEVSDSHGDYPIHIACSLGLLEIVQDLCALGCSLEVTTAKGWPALHLAAKYGHIAVVRCLCAAGCNLEATTPQGIRADIIAFKYGCNEVAELLNKLRISGQRDHFTRQLVPTSKHTVRLNLRLLGHCGVGKTAMVKSLGAGLFSSLFRRSSSIQSNKSSRPSSPVNTQMEMDVTSRQNSITFETPPNYHPTNGIHIQTSDIHNVGEVVIWEFSGQECYFPVYHHFLHPSPNAVTAILFNLDEPSSLQVQQVCFWLNFLLARQNAELPSCQYEKIVLIATHVDQTRATKNHNGEWVSPDAQNLIETVKKQLPHILPRLIETVVILDCNVPASHGFKQMKHILSNIKEDCIQQTLGTSTGLLEHTITWLSNLRHDYKQFPVLDRSNFTEMLRNHVNVLASDDHIDDLLEQLHIMGEVFCVNNLIVLCLPWLGHQLLGELLSSNFIAHSRDAGVYTAEDFQSNFNECDSAEVLQLLEALRLCIHCDIDEEIEYEFPVYNKTETIEGLWYSEDPRYLTADAIYGGCRLYTGSGILHSFQSIFPHIQIELRRTHITTYLNAVPSDSDSDLYQWCQGSKLSHLNLEGLVTLQEDSTKSQYIEIKVRGPPNSAECCFYLLNDIMQTVLKTITLICPGLLLETHILSSEELKAHCDNPYCFEPKILTTAMLEAESTLDVALMNENTQGFETLVQLILFSDNDLARHIQWGCVLNVKDLPGPVKLRLCGLLDPPEPHGRDWCLLAVRLGLCQKKIASLNSVHASHTMRLLSIAECSVGCLISNLLELERQDAADVVLRSATIFKVLVQQVVV